MFPALPLTLVLADGTSEPAAGTANQTSQEEIVIQDAVSRTLAREVSFTSFCHKGPRILQIGNSLERIHDYMYSGETLCFFPPLQKDETDEVITSLHARIKHLFSGGFVFTSKSLASAANIVCSSSSSSAFLQDVLLLIPDRPGCVFTVLKSDPDPTDRKQTMKHVVALAKGIIKTLRRFCNVQFSLVYGIVTSEELSSDKTFRDALVKIADDTSQWSVPVTLTMPQKKYLKMVEAFILSISVVQCLSDSKDDPLWCLTLDQFRTIHENLQKKKVKVKVMPHCGQRVLMLELAARLDKRSPTVIVSKDDKLRAIAKKQKTCEHVLTIGEVSKMIEGDIGHCIVTDCGEDMLEPLDNNWTVLTFVKIPSTNPTKSAAQSLETSQDNYQVDIETTPDIFLKKEKAPDSPKVSAVDGMFQDLFTMKPTGYRESSSFISLSRSMKVLSLTGNETSRKLIGPEVSLGSPVVIYTDTSGPLVNLAFNGFKDQNYGSESQIHIFERSKQEIESYTQNTIRLDQVGAAVKQLQIKRTLTITGQPGEGKTTLGYLVLKEYLKMGRHVYVVRSPAEFFSITNLDNSVVMFNDLFGAFHFDQANLLKWMPVLENLCRLSPNILIVFVSRDHVLQEAMRKLEKFRNLLFSRNTILNLSPSQDDKKKIYKRFQDEHRKVSSLSDSEIDKLVEISFPYGFAHCCQLFFSLDTGKDPLEFFRNPRLFLDTTIAAHYHNDIYRRVAFHLLLYGEGVFDVTKLIVTDQISPTQFEIINLLRGVVDTSEVLTSGRFDYHFQNLQQCFESMCGFFLDKEGHLLRFKHSSIYESVANVICHKSTKLIIEHCNVNSLDYFVHFDKNGQPMSNLNVPLSAESQELLVRRFCLEIQKGHLLPVLRHSLFTTSKGISFFLSRTDLEKVIKLTDRTTERSFCYLACSNQNEKLLTEIINTVKFTTPMIPDVIFGCSEYGNKVGLLLIQALMRVHNIKYSSNIAERACTLAVENDHPDIVEALLADMNLEQRHVFNFNKSYLIAAMKGQKEVVQIFLDNGVVVNTIDSNGWTALHHASDLGDVDLVNLLVYRGCDVNIATKEGLTPSHIATRAGNVEVMQTLRRLGANIMAKTSNGETLLHMAALSGQINMFKEIWTYRINYFLSTVRERETALIYAAKTNFSEAVDMLISSGILVYLIDRNTVLHVAVKQGFHSLVDLLLTKLNSTLFVPLVNAKDKYGCSPIHYAALNGDEQMIMKLLNFSSICIDTSGPNGETPLCIALKKSHVNACHQLLVKGAGVNHRCMDGSTPLHLAVQHNWNMASVNHMLKRGADVNAVTKDKCTPLILAVKSKDISNVQLLLSFKADVNISDKRGVSPLHYACTGGNVVIAEKLLETDTCNVNQSDVDGNTPLIIASRNGSSALVEKLILRGAEPEKRTQNMETSLHLAAKNGHLRTTELLINVGCEVNTQARNGTSALYNTSNKNHRKLAALLLKNGANVDKKCFEDKTALHTASDMGNIQVVQMLLDYGADVNRGDNRQWSAYHFAAQNGFIDIIKLLFVRGGDVNKQTIEGLTCLHLACCRGHNDLVLFLIQYGCRLDITDKSGMNILHVASSFSDRKTLSLLLARGLDPNVSANKGLTALHLAAEKGKIEIATELIERGVDVNVKTISGESTLTICCLKGHEDLVSLLINRGAEIEVENKYGMTPLIAAAMFNHCTIVERLLRAGADIDHSDLRGQTALHMAAGRGNKETINLLLGSGAKHKLTVFGLLPYDYAFFGLYFDVLEPLAITTPMTVYMRRFLHYFLQVMIVIDPYGYDRYQWLSTN